MAQYRVSFHSNFVNDLTSDMSRSHHFGCCPYNCSKNSNTSCTTAATLGLWKRGKHGLGGRFLFWILQMTHEYLNLVFVENKNSGNKLIRSCLKPSSESQSHCFFISFSGCLRTQGFLVPSPPPKYGKTILELHSRFSIHYDFWSELGCNNFITTWSPAEMSFDWNSL